MSWEECPARCTRCQDPFFVSSCSSTSARGPACKYVDKILKGAAPAALPIEQPTSYGLVINLGTAKSLGITVPRVLLVRVDEIIQRVHVNGGHRSAPVEIRNKTAEVDRGR